MNLKKYLEDKKIPWYEFAVKVGVSPNSVGDWINGRKFPRPKNIMKIFKATKGEVNLQDWNNLREKERNLIEKE